MKTNVSWLLVCALGLALGACADDESTTAEATPVADGGTLTPPAPTTDAGTAPPGPLADGATPPASKPIPLIDWVDDLVDHHTNDTSSPDTVDDKNIADNEDPTTFDRRF
jgi:hypothetical protein